MTKVAIVKLIIMYANMYGIDPNIALAVAQAESAFNPAAVGLAGEIGLYQVMPQYVEGYSKKQLSDPATNIKVGIEKLAEAKKDCIHKGHYDWLVCYNYGITAAKHVKHPSLFPYVKRVKALAVNYSYGQN